MGKVLFTIVAVLWMSTPAVPQSKQADYESLDDDRLFSLAASHRCYHGGNCGDVKELKYIVDELIHRYPAGDSCGRYGPNVG
jgi:hypothetical protein